MIFLVILLILFAFGFLIARSSSVTFVFCAVVVGVVGLVGTFVTPLFVHFSGWDGLVMIFPLGIFGISSAVAGFKGFLMSGKKIEECKVTNSPVSLTLRALEFLSVLVVSSVASVGCLFVTMIVLGLILRSSDSTSFAIPILFFVYLAIFMFLHYRKK